MRDTYTVERRKNGAVRIFAYGVDTTQMLSVDQIRANVPSIWAADKHESRSARYTFIPTGAIVEGLMAEGFVPTEVRQGGSRIEGKSDYTKHMIRFRHGDCAPNVVGRGDTLYPELVLANAHDGTGAYTLDFGAYRVICSNAMVASTSYGQVKIPHKGDVMHDVIEGAFKVVKEIPTIVEQANEWARLALDPREQFAFAKAAKVLRWQPDEAGKDTAPIQADELLQVRRREDDYADLWHTFNRVQEGLLTGGQRYTQRNENGTRKARRTVRPVGSVDGNLNLNRALWTLAEEMQRLRA